MSLAAQVLEVVVQQATEAVREHGADPDVLIGRDSPLFGPNGLLDSVGLVSVVLAVEQEIAERLGCTVALADDRALSQRNSPFRTVGSLADYAVQQIEAQRGHG